MFAASKTANVSIAANYIEDVFSTYLYTGTGASLTITNSINLSTKGGLTWIKSRSDALDHKLTDTARGVTKALISNTSGAQTTDTTGLTAFSTTGFTIGADANYNTSSSTYASWTFRKQPKFFDIQTYTGNGTSGRVLNHSLGSTPGCIIWKLTSASGESWGVYHRSLGLGGSTGLWLNLTSVGNDLTTRLTAVSSTSVTLGSNSEINGNAKSYVMYFFAHDAGGFGLSGADNVVSCGSYTGNGSATGPVVTLGYEPQWILFKKSSAGGDDWQLYDNMRGLVTGAGGDNGLFPNLAASEDANATIIKATSTGFQLESTSGAVNASGATYVYVVIRRGPMKVPTDATKVFTPLSYVNSTGGVTISSLTYPADLVITDRKNDISNRAVWDRLRGATKSLYTNLTNTQGDVPDGLSSFASNVGYTTGSGGGADNTVDGSQINWVFGRAPSFLDQVCYTGTGANTTISHNLGAVPELIFVKGRSGGTDWQVYSSALANTEYLVLNTTAAKATGATRWNSTTPTSSVFSLGTSANVNSSGATYVADLFSTCAGVSKVGSYTGNGTTQTINCGFSGGARFVLIKRTDSTGDWYVYDTARGMTTLTDPYLLLSSTAAETATLGSVTTVTTGFALNSTILAAINVNAGTYIFLAIA